MAAGESLPPVEPNKETQSKKVRSGKCIWVGSEWGVGRRRRRRRG